jgi:hypothetical protein
LAFCVKDKSELTSVSLRGELFSPDISVAGVSVADPKELYAMAGW